MPRGRAAIGQVRSGQLGVAIGAPIGNRIWVIEAWIPGVLRLKLPWLPGWRRPAELQKT